MNNLTLIFCTLVTIACSSAKLLPEQTAVDISVHAESIYADKFDNIYAISDKNEILKYNLKGELLFKYANKRNGSVTYLDVSNPQKVLAYIKDFGLLIVFDNTLTEISRIDLNILNYTDIQAVAISNDGSYWLYDEANWRLIKIREDGAIIYESNRLTDYNLSPFAPLYITENENKVLISTDNGEILIFDNFAQYIRKLPLEGIALFSYKNSEIRYYDGKYSKSYNITLHQEIKSQPYFHEEVIDILHLQNGYAVHLPEGIILRNK